MLGLITILALCAMDTTSSATGGQAALTADTTWVIECGWEHEMWFERDTVEGRTPPRLSGQQWYIPLVDGGDVRCDRARVISKKER